MPPIPPLFRSTDPDTSRAAATACDSERSVAIVRAVLCDGAELLDEEIHDAAIARGLFTSDGRTRHGRRWLELAGEVVCVGRRATRAGKMARVWRVKACDPPPAEYQRAST